MTMKSILLASTAVVALSAAAFAADETYQSNTRIEKDANGNYNEKNTVTKTEADGTTNSSAKNVSIKEDSEGNTDKTSTTERVTDPKGLGNKHVVTTRDTEKNDDG